MTRSMFALINHRKTEWLRAAACSLLALLWLGAPLLAAENPAATPEKRNDWSEPVTAMWAKRAMDQQGATGINVLFLGDSITQLWLKDSRWPNGQEVWDKTYAPMKACNLGVAGERTENLLWRIREGKMIDGLTPKAVVLLIGVNNLTGWGGRQGGDTPDNLAGAVKQIIGEVQARMPETKILLLGIFPALDKDNPIREKIRQTNLLLTKLQQPQKVEYLEFGEKFLAPDGTAPKEMLRDGIHLSPAAYAVWAEAMTPTLQRLLSGETGANPAP